MRNALGVLAWFFPFSFVVNNIKPEGNCCHKEQCLERFVSNSGCLGGFFPPGGVVWVCIKLMLPQLPGCRELQNLSLEVKLVPCFFETGAGIIATSYSTVGLKYRRFPGENRKGLMNVIFSVQFRSFT